ncbi:ABC transporter ATP-binding protein [Loigolactobacillus jiayinensis]|nr:ABC transporter ATP-binding protein [Loigolactobacillus jiayinensis]
MSYLQEQQVTTYQMFKYVFTKVLKNRWLLIGNVLILAMMTVLQFIMPQFTQYIIDKVIPKANFQELFWTIGLMLLAAIVLGVFNYFSTYYMGVMSQNTITDLRNELYERIIRQDTHFFESSKTGDIMVRLTSDINNLQSLISPNMLSMIGSMFTFIGVYIFIFFVNWQMALAVTITLPLMFVIYRVFRTRIRQSFLKARGAQAKMSNQMQNTLTQIELIKSYTSETQESDKFAEFANENRDYTVSATWNQAVFSPLISFINYLGTAIILLLGAYFVIKKQLTVGGLVAYISYVAMLQSPIQSFTRLLNQLQQSLVSYGRIVEISQVQPTILNAPNAVPFPDFHDRISIQKASFAYPDSSKTKTTVPAIKQVSFDIPYAQTTALVGHSGSGKTTLTNLLDRLYDLDSGDILYDGVPIKKIELQSLRQHIAIVSQDVAMIDGTVRDNIRYGAPQATDDRISQVAQLADIADFIRNLPNGLETQVGERGMRLSGGQKQRIAIARALLKDSPIIILDEATAALDNESEKAIQHALDNLLEQRTSLVIAHRLSTVHNADNIIALDDGQVVETGTHQQLMAQHGYYRQLYDAQFK